MSIPIGELFVNVRNEEELDKCLEKIKSSATNYYWWRMVDKPIIFVKCDDRRETLVALLKKHNNLYFVINRGYASLSCGKGLNEYALSVEELLLRDLSSIEEDK